MFLDRSRCFALGNGYLRAFPAGCPLQPSLPRSSKHLGGYGKEGVKLYPVEYVPIGLHSSGVFKRLLCCSSALLVLLKAVKPGRCLAQWQALWHLDTYEARNMWLTASALVLQPVSAVCLGLSFLLARALGQNRRLHSSAIVFCLTNEFMQCTIMLVLLSRSLLCGGDVLSRQISSDIAHSFFLCL